jgi:hypothetical protein
MQMMFQPGVSTGSATRSQPRRGTFALEPIEALPRLAERINRLAERSLETNPFFLPDFLEPAIKALGKKSLRLAIFSDRDDLHFFAPVVVSGGQVLGGRTFTVWAHPYAPLGSPLIDREAAPLVTDALIAHMRTSGRTIFSIPHLPLRDRRRARSARPRCATASGPSPRNSCVRSSIPTRSTASPASTRWSARNGGTISTGSSGGSARPAP